MSKLHIPRRKGTEAKDRITGYVSRKCQLAYKIGKEFGYDTPKMVREADEAAMDALLKACPEVAAKVDQILKVE